MKGRITPAPSRPIDAKRPFQGTERFELIRRLGEGGYGAVYEVHDRSRDQRVALKLLTRVGPEHLMRFKQEFRALQDLQHPNLVQLNDVFEDEGRWFFTMELVRGVDWLEYVRGAKHARSSEHGAFSRAMGFELPRLRASLAQLIEGVLALHRAGKVHRDIKPSNVHVTNDGRVVLLDFGLVTSVETRQTNETLALGTAAYMAPEQATGVPVGPAADWYSVGVVLYEALTGRLPFVGTAFEMLLSKQSSEPTPPRVLIPDIPVDLSALCVGLLKSDPRARLTGEEIQRHGLGATGADSELSLGRPSSPALTRGVPFVGREGERRVLTEIWERVRDGARMGAVYVHGESGVGKTALVQEFTEEIEGRSRVVVLRGRCYERETVPYKAFDGVVDALARFLWTLDDAACAALLPQRSEALPMVFPVLGRVKAITTHAGPRYTDMDRATLRTHALSALRALFARIAEAHPLIVVIDDLQWADAESLALLTELARPPDEPRLMLIVTARDAEECPVEVQRALSTLLEQASLAERVRVDGLPLSYAERLARVLLEAGEGGPSQVSAEEIAREAEGHPLFIDALVLYSQHVRLSGACPELDDALRFRIGQLELDARKLLELCSLAAAPLPHKVVADAAGLSHAHAGTIIGKLRVLKLVRTSRTRRVDTVETFHDRIQKATVSRLEHAERLRLHRKLAQAIEASDLPDAEAAAFHFREACVFEKAALFAARAGDRAMENLAFDKAARLYREAIELHPADSFDVRVKLADALSNAGRGSEAADVYMSAIEGAPPEQQNELRRRAVQELLGSGDIDAGMSIAHALLAALDVSIPKTTQAATMSLLVQRARLTFRGLGFRESAAAEVPEEDLARVDALWAVAALGTVDHLRGAELQTRHLLCALDTGEPYRISRALAMEAWLEASSGRAATEKSALAVTRALELAHSSEHPHALGLAHLAAGVNAYHHGRLKEARSQCEAGETVLLERCTGVAWEITNARLFGMLAGMSMADFTALRRRADAALRESIERGDRYAYANLTMSVGYLLSLYDGRPEDAQAAVDEAVEAWSQRGFYLQHFMAFVAKGQLLLAAQDYERAVRMIDETWQHLERSQLLRAQAVSLHARWLRARAYAAYVKRKPSERQRLKVVLDDAKYLEKNVNVLAPAFALSIRAAVSHVKGETQRALSMLKEARASFERHDMEIAALGYGYAAGQIEGGEAGQTLAKQTAEKARENGLLRIDYVTQVYWPF